MDNNWKLDLEEYIRQGEPDQAGRSAAWKTAIGLQDVDGLKTSEYLLETAKEHIEGKIDIATVQKRIDSYYEEQTNRKSVEAGTMEADVVSVRIAQLLAEKTFQFSPAEYQSIHRQLFTGVFDHAGKIRDYNISKKEWVLNGQTVYYASCASIRDTLEYDFSQEKGFSYEGLTAQEAVRHIVKFTAGIWQIHPFCEGNTRTTAVFILKYLRTFGFSVSNDVFAENSWYFRNALVRANYNDLQNGITATTKYLELFFDNLLLGQHHELKNRYLHVNFGNGNDGVRETPQFPNCSLNELAVLKEIIAKPSVTQKELAQITGQSERTIKRVTVALQEKGIIQRENGKRNGRWEIISGC